MKKNLSKGKIVEDSCQGLKRNSIKSLHVKQKINFIIEKEYQAIIFTKSQTSLDSKCNTK